MLSKILSEETCAKCKFCCSFRRQSLWETPVFTENEMLKLQIDFPKAKFRKITTDNLTKQNIYTIDLYEFYKTDDPEEESPCPFLNTESGCMLPEKQKPFDCAIWPLRAIRKNNKTIVVLCPTCKALNKIPLEKIKDFVNSSGLKNRILEEAKKNPGMIKEWKDEFIDLS
jgi:hypothetical protein